MSTELFPKFIESKGYWYNIRQEAKNSFSVFNTQRKRNQKDRDGIGYIIETFDNFDDAKKFLDNINYKD